MLLLIPSSSLSCRGQSVQNSRERQVFLGRRSRARQRVPRTRHSCEVSRRASSLANDKKASSVLHNPFSPKTDKDPSCSFCFVRHDRLLHVNHRIADSRKTSFGRSGQRSEAESKDARGSTSKLRWQHTDARGQGTLISVSTLLVIRGNEGGVCPQ